MKNASEYPPECPAFKIVRGNGVPIGAVVEGLGPLEYGSLIQEYSDPNALWVRVPKTNAIHDFYLYVLKPLTPASKAMYKIAGGEM